MSEKEKTTTAPLPGEKKITLWHGIGFGLGDFYGGGSGALTGAYLALFWTTFAGLKIDQAMSIQGVTLMLSAITAIVIGALSDNMFKFKIGRKFGRRRVFLLIGSPLLLTAIGMWLPGMPYYWYFTIFLIWTILNQFIMIPYATLPSEMTSDFNGRTILSTTRMFISGVVGTLVPIIGGSLLATLGDDKASTYTVIGTIFTVLFSLCVFIAYKTTWERPISDADLLELEESQANKGKFNLGRSVKELWNVIVSYATTLRVRAFQRHMAIYLLGVSFADIFGQVFVFFVVFNLTKSAAFASALLAIGIIWQPFAPVQGWMFAKLGVRPMYSLCFGGCIASLLGFYFLWQQTGVMDKTLLNTLTFVVMGAWLFFKGLIYFLPWNVFPFIPDIDEIMTRHRREGSFSAMVLFLRRLTQGFSSIAVGAYLATTGFKSGALKQTLEAQTGLANVMIWWVIAGFALAWIIALGFKLNKKTHGMLIDEMERLREGGSKDDVTPETRKVVENLTGIKYEKVWPALPEIDDNVTTN